MDVNAAAPHADEDTSGGANADALRTQLRHLTLRQQRFERYLGRRLHADPAGLAVMDHLVNVGPASPTDLARGLDTSTAAMTLVIDRLVAGGHATREPHPTDRRRVVVTPAADWESTAWEYVSPLVRGITDAADALTPGDRATVTAFLQRVIGAYDEATRP